MCLIDYVVCMSANQLRVVCFSMAYFILVPSISLTSPQHHEILTSHSFVNLGSETTPAGPGSSYTTARKLVSAPDPSSYLVKQANRQLLHSLERPFFSTNFSIAGVVFDLMIRCECSLPLARKARHWHSSGLCVRSARSTAGGEGKSCQAAPRSRFALARSSGTDEGAKIYNSRALHAINRQYLQHAV